MTGPELIPLQGFEPVPEEEMLRRAKSFRELVSRRRSVRSFDSRPVPREIIAECIAAAGTAPSGANLQPWHFVAVSDPNVKRRIRVAAEQEERQFYQRRAPKEWLEALAPLGTDSNKPFLENAPWLIAVFVRKWGKAPDGRKVKHYYPTESVGIATGIMLTALHQAGLATLTHTPSPMGFLNEILGRPADSERPFLLLVAGYPATDARVPDLERKSISVIADFL
jgi:iodotyrosine deiodinase